jgi:hypothetical protein
MAWLRIDDGFAEHPKVLAAGPLGVTLHVRALCWCNRRLTDGLVPRSVLPSLMADIDDPALPDKLVTAGLWEIVDEATFKIHDFLVYNFSKKQVLRRRGQDAKRSESYRNRHGGRHGARHARITRESAESPAGVQASPSPSPVSSSPLRGEVTTVSKQEVQEPQTDVREGKTQGSIGWDAYAAAYEKRYGVPPVRNRKANSIFKHLSESIPVDEVPAVAAFYLTCDDVLYVRAKHPVDLLKRDIEGLRTGWMTRGTRATLRSGFVGKDWVDNQHWTLGLTPAEQRELQAFGRQHDLPPAEALRRWRATQEKAS